MLAVNWANSMNHVKRGQLSARRNHSFARGQSFRETRSSNLATLFENFCSARTMNRPVNAAATEERGICRIDDRIDVLFSDIADDDAHAAVKKFSFAFRVHERISRDDSPATT